MKEMEVKVLKIDPQAIEKKLIQLGAKKVKEENQLNRIYDTEDGYLEKSSKGYARIRVIEDLINQRTQAYLTVKKNQSKEGLRTNIEHQISIPDQQAMALILEDLGYVLKHSGQKHRLSYQIDEMLFEIDTWDQGTYPEPYLEIEVTQSQDLNRALKLLGLNPDQVTTKSIQEIKSEREARE